MITGLSDYRAPFEQSIRCVCGLRYVVFTGGSDFDQAAIEAAKNRAQARGAQFVNARIIPFILCVGCGALLDFTAADTCELVM